MNVALMASPWARAPRWLTMAINLALFQVAWFACVLGAAHHHPWLGTGAVALVAIVHLWMAPRPLPELRLMLIAGAIGLVFDTVLLHIGGLIYTSGHLPGAWGAALAPHWIVASWVLLATGLNVSMRWMKRRYLTAALMGAIAAPWSYWAGARLGAVRFDEPALLLTVLAIGWALLMPALVWLGDEHDGFAPLKHAA